MDILIPKSAPDAFLSTAFSAATSSYMYRGSIRLIQFLDPVFRTLVSGIDKKAIDSSHLLKKPSSNIPNSLFSYRESMHGHIYPSENMSGRYSSLSQ
jgi:hypothetical protein